MRLVHIYSIMFFFLFFWHWSICCRWPYRLHIWNYGSVNQTDSEVLKLPHKCSKTVWAGMKPNRLVCLNHVLKTPWGSRGEFWQVGGQKKKNQGGCNVFPFCQQNDLSPGTFSVISRGCFVLCFFYFYKNWEPHVGRSSRNSWKPMKKLHFLLAHVENSPTNQRRRNKTKHMECFSTTTKHFIFSCKSMHVLTTVTLFHKKVLLLFCSLLVYIWWRKMFKIKPKLLFYFVLT